MKMTFGIYRGLAALLLVGSYLVLSADPATAADPKAGAEWEIKTTMEIPGMPFALPPTVIRQCLEDKAVPYQEKKNEKCETVYKNMSGNTLSWQVVCDSKDGKMEMTGETSYASDSMDSKVKMKSKNGDISMHMTGKKLGACK